MSFDRSKSEAINYASESASAGVNQASVNLSFLEIVVEFSSYLTPQDKKSMFIDSKAFILLKFSD